MHKTFISYKYSDAVSLRDRIIGKLGDNAKYYNGEHVNTPDMSDLELETQKRKLKDMMFDTSVTIVILSPNMNDSKWIDWEIQYCLKKIKRKDRTSQTNGVVAVIQKINNSYDWFIKESKNCHGTTVVSYNMDKIPTIISDNHFNSVPPMYHCLQCKTYDQFNGSYISFVKEDVFLLDTEYYIDNAYEKSENNADGYKIQL